MTKGGKKKIAIATILVASGIAVVDTEAQNMSGIGETSVLSPLNEGNLSRARAMMGAGNYQGVIDQLRKLRETDSRLSMAEREESDFLLAEALYYRGNSECVNLFDKFASEYPASERALEAELLAADYYYFNKEFGASTERYLEIDMNGLDKKTRNQYLMREGISLIKSGKYSTAEEIFRTLKLNKEYEARAKFYLAYIDYVEGDLNKAYEGFKSVENELPGMIEETKSVGKRVARKDIYEPTGYEATYYLTQIEFTRGNYSEVENKAYYLLQKKGVEELRPETERILGESYFKTGNQNGAITYLTDYVRDCEKLGIAPEPSALYALGSSLYDEGDLTKAKEAFIGLTNERSALGQGAWLYLGQIAAKGGENKEAAIDFEKAYKMNFDQKLAETALYNYGVTATKSGGVPFSSSSAILEEFLKKYPNSKYSTTVREYLATAYFNDKNYGRAMEYIEQIKNPSAKVLSAKQKVAYELGVAALSNDKLADAVKYMQIATTTGSDKELANVSYLWLGDAYYAQKQYAKAREAYTTYLGGAKKDNNRTLGLYDLAYTLYMEKTYSKAADKFLEAIEASPALPQTLLLDAKIRRADCLYYTGNSKLAMSSYNEAINAGAADADYAMLRRATLNGIMGNLDAKISDLDQLLSKYPDSKWGATALLEKGLALAEKGKLSESEQALRGVLQRYESTAEARKAILNLAIIMNENGKSSEAIEAYKDVISRWPSSEESYMAHTDLQKIYAAKGELMDYAGWLSSVKGGPQIDRDEMESLVFDAAERALISDGGSTKKLEEYLTTYPNGRYVSQALLDIAEMRNGEGKYEEAFTYVNRLLTTQPKSSQTAPGLLLKGELLEQRLNQREAALEAYKELEATGGASFANEAWSGIMRTTPDATERLKYAQKLTRVGGLSNEGLAEAKLYEALAYKSLGDETKAIAELKELADSSEAEAGAQAAVELGQIYLEKKDYKGAEKVLSDFTEKGSDHQYWLARGFIGLADAYRGEGKTYLAVEYLNSLKENYPGKEADIAEMINSRLKAWK